MDVGERVGGCGEQVGWMGLRERASGLARVSGWPRAAGRGEWPGGSGGRVGVEPAPEP